VLCVIIGHYVGYRFSGFHLRPIRELIPFGPSIELIENVALRVTAPLGELGVQFFFVISGFLITQLLNAEENRNGNVSLGAFYSRRVFRIIPAFAVYLTAVWLLRHQGLIRLTDEAFARSGAFLCNVSEFKCSWWLAHTWSLSVEEQFYLIWPCLFIIASAQYRLTLIWSLLASLIIGSIFEPGLGSFANIAAGALLALSTRARDLVQKCSSRSAVFGCLLFVVVQPVIPQLHYIVFAVPLIVAFVFFSTVNTDSPMRGILSARPFQWLGLISYSAYLWQQISTAPMFWGAAETGAAVLHSSFPSATWLFLLPAAASFFLVEMPMQRIGRGLSSRLINLQLKSR
jgi:peptidoglycan/LPS O-acetylase OafA/YrhL